MKKDIDVNEVRKNLKIRDKLDIDGGNFIKPINAIEINTTDLLIGEVYSIMLNYIYKVINKE